MFCCALIISMQCDVQPHGASRLKLNAIQIRPSQVIEAIFLSVKSLRSSSAFETHSVSLLNIWPVIIHPLTIHAEMNAVWSTVKDDQIKTSPYTKLLHKELNRMFLPKIMQNYGLNKSKSANVTLHLSHSRASFTFHFSLPLVWSCYFQSLQSICLSMSACLTVVVHQCGCLFSSLLRSAYL